MKLAGNAALEASVTAGQTAAQGGSPKETVRNAKIAAAVPLVGRGLSILVKKGIPFAASVATGLQKSDLVLAKNYPEAMRQAVRHVEENSKQPFYQLSQTIAGRLKQAYETAGKTYESAIAALSERIGTKGYDVSRRVTDLAGPLKTFNLGLTLTKRQASAAPAAVNRLRIVANPQTPFSSRELGVLEDLVNTVHQSKKISLPDVVDLQRKFQRAYDAVPLTQDGKATPFHALVRQLEDKFDEIATDTVPGLKDINEAFKTVRTVYADYAPTLLDSQGAVKEGAESFVSNIVNRNKGAALENLKALEDLTGVPIEDNVILLRTAERLNNLFPATGSRTQDIIRALGISGAGFAAGGGLGSILAAAASSPKVAGKVAMLLGRFGKNIRPGVAETLLERAAGR